MRVGRSFAVLHKRRENVNCCQKESRNVVIVLCTCIECLPEKTNIKYNRTTKTKCMGSVRYEVRAYEVLMVERCHHAKREVGSMFHQNRAVVVLVMIIARVTVIVYIEFAQNRLIWT